MAKHPPKPKWLQPNEAADHLENVYPRTDPEKLTKQIREPALAILFEYPKEKSALKLLSVCNAALDSGDYCQARIRAIISAYRGIDPAAWAQAKGAWERLKKYEAGKVAARRKADEIWADHGRKPSIRGLWGLVAKALYPDLSGEELKVKAHNLRTQHGDWKPSDKSPGIVVA